MRFPVPRTGALSLPRLSFDLQEWNVAIGFACGIALHFALSMGSWMLQRAGLPSPRPQPSAAQNPPPEARTA